jgi:hypothetical protein
VRKLGTLTIEVFAKDDGGNLWCRPETQYSEALNQMQALMSPAEKGMQAKIMAELLTTVGAFFTYVQNPDCLKVKP